MNGPLLLEFEHVDLVVRPAYGRRYETAELLLADWVAGKEFKCHNGPVISNRSLETIRAKGYTRVIFVWMNLANKVFNYGLYLQEPN
jgi:hypothetical protein